MFQHLGGCFSPCFSAGRKYMFLDLRLVWKQSKTGKSVSSPTNTVGFDTLLKQQWQFALLTDRHQRWLAPCDNLVVPNDLEAG